MEFSQGKFIMVLAAVVAREMYVSWLSLFPPSLSLFVSLSLCPSFSLAVLIHLFIYLEHVEFFSAVICWPDCALFTCSQCTLQFLYFDGFTSFTSVRSWHIYKIEPFNWDVFVCVFVKERKSTTDVSSHKWMDGRMDLMFHSLSLNCIHSLLCLSFYVSLVCSKVNEFMQIYSKFIPSFKVFSPVIKWWSVCPFFFDATVILLHRAWDTFCRGLWRNFFFE